MENLTNSELARFLILFNSYYTVKHFNTKNGQTVSVKNVEEIYAEMRRRSTSTAYWDKQIKQCKRKYCKTK